jgi:glutamyl-tRNA synthetase
MLRWGNFKIDAIRTSATDGAVTEVIATYLPESTDYKKTKKLTWLADVDDNITATLTEYDHLISKPKLEDCDDFQNFLTPVTVGTMPAIVDACLRLVPAGQVVQLERRGFYRVDKAYGGPADPMVLINVPDGRTKSMSTLSSALVHR